MNLYRIIRDILAFVVKITFRVERIGVENIPASGSCIFCGNHISMWDPVFIATTKARDFSFIAKEEIVKVPVIGAIIKRLNVIPIKRGAGDLGAMRKSIEVLKENKALVIFPEGTRSKDGTLKEGKDGVALIVKKTQCNVVPCAIIGKPRLFNKIKMVYGKPLDLTEYINEKDNKAITKTIMNEIRNLMEAYNA